MATKRNSEGPGPNDIVWGDNGFFPSFYGFCPSPVAWRRQLVKMKVSPIPYPTSPGHCTAFWSAKTDYGTKLVQLVTLGPELDKRTIDEISGVIVHEATHVWRHIRKDIGEKKPSPEFEAYSMQMIYQSLFTGYVKTRRPELKF